jgi:hypothetical protein
MGNDAKLLGVVRGLQQDTRLPTNREDEQFQLSGQNELLTVYGASDYQEDVRNGRTFFTNNTTAVALVTAIPTTAVNIALYNNEPDGGRSYIILRVCAQSLAGGAVLYHAGMIGCLGQVREAIPTNSAMTIKCANGSGKLDTRARTIVAASTLPAGTGIAANWFPMSNSKNSVVVSLGGMGLRADINGKYIVPPGRYFGMHVLGSAVGSTWMMSVLWTEENLLMG